MGLFDFLGKKYAGWSMDVDGTEQDGFSIKEVEGQLSSVLDGSAGFLILTPPEPIAFDGGRKCNFIQVCCDEDQGSLHFEVSTVGSKSDEDVLIYGKDQVDQASAQALIKDFLERRIVPNVHGWEVVLDMRAGIDAESYGEIAALLADDSAALSNLELCFADPHKYFEAHAEQFDERGMDDDESADAIAWIALADELIACGAAVELDWKEGLAEFALSVRQLADACHLELRPDWLEEDDDIPSWCHVLGERWKKQGFCVGSMDIGSDSYVIFVCQRPTLESLIGLGHRIGHRFDLTENM